MSVTQAVDERLDSIPARWLPPGFLNVARRAAAAQRMSSEVRSQAEQALADIQAALAKGDTLAAAAASERRAGLERLSAELPADQIPPELASEALGLAERDVRAALAAMPACPVVAYGAEVRAWRSLPHLGSAVVDPPRQEAAADAAAQRAVEDLVARRGRVEVWAGRWLEDAHRQGLDPVSLLRGAAGVMAAAREYGTAHDQVAAQVDEANRARKAAGLTWCPPAGISTPAIEQLKET